MLLIIEKWAKVRTNAILHARFSHWLMYHVLNDFFR